MVFVDCVLQEADLEPSSIVLTEYSTFTYYLTSLIAGQTVTKTDIIVSSNVVTQSPQATPLLEPSPSPVRPTITGKCSTLLYLIPICVSVSQFAATVEHSEKCTICLNFHFNLQF